jgi:host factor-I protein
MPFSDQGQKKKAPPPECTNEEAAYLKKLAEKQTPISLKLVNGETLRGWIEYYDRNMLRLTRQGKPNLFVYKNQISYLVEER